MTDGGSDKAALLVLDDEPLILNEVVEVLGDEFAVHTAASIAEARTVLEACPELAAILVDRRLSGQDGIGFLAEAQGLSHATRILLTGYPDLEAVLRAINEGRIFACLTKPWKEQELRQVVRRATARYGANRELVEQRRLFRNLLDSMPDGVYFKDRDRRYIRLNNAAANFLGLDSPDDAIGRTVAEIFDSELGRIGADEDRRIIAEGVSVYDRISRRMARDGTVRWTSTTKAPVLDDQGRPYRIVGIVRDVTDRLRSETENALLVQLAQMISASPDVESALATAVGSICERMGWPYGEAWTFDKAGDRLVACHGWAGGEPRTQRFRAATEALSFAVGEGLPGRVWQARRAEHIDDLWAVDAEVFRRQQIARDCGLRSALAVPAPGEDGGTLAVLVFFAAEQGAFADRRLAELIGIVTAQLGLLLERRRAVEALRLSEQRFKDFSEAASDYLSESDAEFRFTYVSENFLRDCGRRAEEVIGHRRWDLDWIELEPDVTWASLRRHLGAHRPYREFRYRARRPDGERVHMCASGRPFYDAQGNFAGYRSAGRNVTDEVRASEMIRAKQALLENILGAIPQFVFWKDRRSHFLGCNSRFAAFVGLANAADIAGKTDFDLSWAEDNAVYFRTIDARVMASGEALLDVEETLHRLDGSVAVLRSSKVPLRDEGGEVIGLLGIFADITEHRQMAEQLNHARKMDAVGQLTGGIAHDFNNLLTVIVGNLQLLERTPEMDERTRALARRALGAAHRGADLTRRLLAFSRRQMLEPRVVDVNGIVAEFGPLLRRSIGETIEVEVVSREAELYTRVDPGQLETSLLNLAINARDAMPEGGQLTVELGTAWLDATYARTHLEVEPGEYVLIAVTDSGTGIAPDILDRVFEPFFTTKEIGKGTGLGLSMIYGFVKQSAGHVSIYSEVGIGTTVKLYFPRAAGPAEASDEDRQVEEETLDGGETILVVEDSEDVRATLVALLKNLGYRVLEADSGARALAVLDEGGSVDLMITDVVMPGGMSGPQLIESTRARWPGILFLMTSGYPREALSRNGSLKEKVSFLPKPFRNHELARRVRELLDSRAKPTGGMLG